eukprot:4640716-Amphidinium_carterae.1
MFDWGVLAVLGFRAAQHLVIQALCATWSAARILEHRTVVTHSGRHEEKVEEPKPLPIPIG